MLERRSWLRAGWMCLLTVCMVLSIPGSIEAKPAIPPVEQKGILQDDATGSISGFVYEADGTTPISGANVTAVNAGQTTAHIAFTNSDGSYSIQSLPSDGYRVYAQHTEHILEYYNNTYIWNQATLVNITAPENKPNINFTMDQGGSISGHVYQADGITPISGAIMTANAIGVDWANYPIFSTAADGSYLITGIPTGNYRVKAEANGYVTKYYNGTYAYNEATPVHVTAPNNTPNININLDVSGSISGHVYQNNGTTPISGVTISAMNLNLNFYRSATSTADGSYTITGLPSDSYKVSTSVSGYVTEYYNNTGNTLEATPVTVTAPGNTANINFTMDPSGSISGHVYQADRVTPLSGVIVQASLADKTSGFGQSNADGSYLITGAPPGNNRVYAYINGFVSEYYDNVYKPEQAAMVSVTVAQTTPNIDFSLDPGGLISGFVYGTNGTTPVSGATISATDQTNRTWQTTSGSNGSYTTPYLPAGDYTVKAEAAGYVTEYFDGAATANEATPVTVQIANTTAAVNFTIDPVVETPPTVATDNATNITCTAAILNGNLALMGTATMVNVSFQYGLASGDYINETTIQTMDDIGQFHFNLSNLANNTTYYYRAKAVGQGTVYGSEKSFRTAENKVIPTAATENATNIGENSARLNATVTSLGTVTSVQVHFAWGTTTGSYTETSQAVTISAAGPLHYDVTGLTSDTAYYFRAFISYIFGPGDEGEFATEPERTFTTDAVTPPPTTTPTNTGGGFVGGFSGSGGGPTGPGITNLALYTNSEGLFVLDGKAKSEDGCVNIDIAKGVLAQTKDKAQLKSIKIVAVDSPVELLSGFRFAGKVYEITPDGATFTPGIILTLTYSPDEIPEGTDINSLSIMVYNPATAKWELLSGKVDTAKSCVTATIEHFSIYTIAGKKAAPPATTPVYIPLPAKFSIANISIEPAPGTISSAGNNIVVISTKVSNTGEKAGDYELVLKINGMSEEARTVTVGAGETKAVSFTVSRGEPGEYEVEINGAKASFTVQEPAPATTTPSDPVETPPNPKGTNWLVAGLIIVGIIIIAGAGVLVLRKRHTNT